MLWELARAMTVRRDAFRARAYQRAAQSVESSAVPVEDMAAAGRLKELPGVGDGIAKKVEEFLATGSSGTLERLRKQMPSGLPDLMGIQGLGPRRALQLATELGIQDVAGLEAALRAGKVRKLKGFGAVRERALLAAVRERAAANRRIPYAEAEAAAGRLRKYLAAATGVDAIEAAGSLRRGRDTVGDLDFIAAARGAGAARLIAAFTSYPGAASVIEKGTTRARIRLRDGTGADLRVLPPASWGAALIYFTGSKEHNIQLRQRALKRGWSLNESSLHVQGTKRRLAGATEEQVYAKLGLAWIPPELREGQDEMADAEARALPRLLEPSDLKGDLHVHTEASDGRHSLRAMLAAAARAGYGYIGVSDHGETLRIANGLTGARYAAQRRDIEALRDDFPGLTVLQGAELDILKDGSLGLDRASQRRLDYVIGSVHSAFRLPAAEQTERLLAAIGNGIDILGHPSGRMFPRRPGIEADWPRVYQAAKDAGVLLEVDGTPDRLDMSGDQVRIARGVGCRFTVDSDAHATGELEQIRYGVIQARRGGLEARHVANAGSLRQLVKCFGHAR